MKIVKSITGQVYDTVKFHSFTSMIVVVGGFTDKPTDPQTPGQGAWRVAVQMYRTGYDAWMFNEIGVGGPELLFTVTQGQPYREIEYAFNRRSVSTFGVYGYSRGGGRGCDLLNAAAANLGILAAFSGYCDAVGRGVPETRRPTGSQFHLNYYEENTPLPHGASTQGLQIGDVEVNASAWTPKVGHWSIDNDGKTLSAVITNMMGHMPTP